MRQMVYTSVATGQMGQDDVFRIIEKSVSNNLLREITGFLVYSDRRFLQMIEGEEANLRNLLTALRADRRHRDITVLLNQPITARRFPRWRMQRIGRDGAGLDEVRRVLGDCSQSEEVLRQVEQFLAPRANPPLYATG